MIPQLKRYMQIDIYVINTLLIIVCILLLYSIFKFLFLKKDIFSIEKFPSKEIVMLNRKTTILNLVFLPIFMILLFIDTYAIFEGKDDYKKYFNNEYYEGEFIVVKTSRSGGRYYSTRYVTLERLKDKKRIQFKIIKDKYKPGECYYVQHYDKLQYGAFGKKIDCVTKETIESYCDLDVCK